MPSTNSDDIETQVIGTLLNEINSILRVGFTLGLDYMMISMYANQPLIEAALEMEYIVLYSSHADISFPEYPYILTDKSIKMFNTFLKL